MPPHRVILRNFARQEDERGRASARCSHKSETDAHSEEVREARREGSGAAGATAPAS